MWPGKSDLNTLRVDGNTFEFGEKTWRIQKYPDTCGRGLSIYLLALMSRIIVHFTVVCLVAWPVNESEAGVDLVLIETSLPLLCKLLLISMTTTSLT